MKRLLPFFGIIFLGVFFLLFFWEKKKSFSPLSVGNRMKLESKSFPNSSRIPSKYTCDGEDISPPLTISSVPVNAQSLVLIVDDPDAPSGLWTHWLVWNISSQIKEIEEGKVPEKGIEGVNSFGQKGYRGPCPPAGTHRYFFKLYALDKTLDLSSQGKEDRANLEREIEGHILAEAQLVGIYSRQK